MLLQRRGPIPLQTDSELLSEYADSVRTKFAAILPNASVAPLFPGRSRGTVIEPGMEWHSTASALSHRIAEATKRTTPRSERTGRRLVIGPIRLRRTLASRAAAEGHDARVIAELLDQSDTQNVGVYVELRAETIRRIDRAIAFKMAPLARAFAGTLVSSPPAAETRVTDPRFDPTMRCPVGSCGLDRRCSLAAPLSCYTCSSFHPWLEGPHEAVLDHLLSERERLIEAADSRIASINDRVICAVAEVVLRCRSAQEMPSQHG
jgi:hypothetical protein